MTMALFGIPAMVLLEVMDKEPSLAQRVALYGVLTVVGVLLARRRWWLGLTVLPVVALLPIPGSPFASGTFPMAIAFDGSSRFAYAITKLQARSQRTPLTRPPVPWVPMPTPQSTGAASVALTVTTNI